MSSYFFETDNILICHCVLVWETMGAGRVYFYSNKKGFVYMNARKFSFSTISRGHGPGGKISVYIFWFYKYLR